MAGARRSARTAKQHLLPAKERGKSINGAITSEMMVNPERFAGWNGDICLRNSMKAIKEVYDEAKAPVEHHAHSGGRFGGDKGLQKNAC